MDNLVAILFFLFVLSQSVIGQSIHAINPYIPMLVAPKNPLVQCPYSCSSAKDCFLVHPLSENHFYSCFHGKAMVHQCPIGKSFSDEKHQCVVLNKHPSLGGLITNVKVAKLTKKIVLLEHLIESFQEKMTKVQNVIIDSDNKIGLLGKFLLKALKTNQENLCSKTNQKESTQAPVVESPEADGEGVPVFTPPPNSADDEEQVELNGLQSDDQDPDDNQEGPPSISVPANSPKVDMTDDLSVSDDQTVNGEQPQLTKDDDFANVDDETEIDEGASPQENLDQVLVEDGDEGVQVGGVQTDEPPPTSTENSK